MYPFRVSGPHDAQGTPTRRPAVLRPREAGEGHDAPSASARRATLIPGRRACGAARGPGSSLSDFSHVEAGPPTLLVGKNIAPNPDLESTLRSLGRVGMTTRSIPPCLGRSSHFQAHLWRDPKPALRSGFGRKTQRPLPDCRRAFCSPPRPRSRRAPRPWPRCPRSLRLLRDRTHGHGLRRDATSPMRSSDVVEDPSLCDALG